MESSALAIWLLDYEIDENERVGRSFAFRYDGLNAQLKIANSNKTKDRVEKIKNRMNAVENNALKLGYPRVEDKYKKRIGIGKRMPSRTDIIEMSLSDIASYRVFSSIVHFHPSALMQASFQQASNNMPNYHEKYLDLKLFAHLCQVGAISFSIALWHKALLFGWNIENFETVFQLVFDKLKIPQENYFWLDR